MTRTRIAVLVSTLSLTIAGGTVFFHYVEDWSWIDSYFFAVVTLSTVGYGSLVPETWLGKLGTTFFIFVGLGVFAAVIQQIAQFTLLTREERLQRREEAELERERIEDQRERLEEERERIDHELDRIRRERDLRSE